MLKNAFNTMIFGGSGSIASIGKKCLYKFMGDVDLLVFWISMFTIIHP